MSASPVFPTSSPPMCGLTGWFLYTSHPDGASREQITRSALAIAHRGPDDVGVWVDSMGRVALGHRRLAILDLSAEGHQPMTSPSGRYVAAFNGEVYNHLDLRRELTGVAWRGHSDTETILAAIDRWGLEVAVSKFVGMFAIALWDTVDQALWLVRDRLGIKPLYYGFTEAGLSFGSELGALRSHPGFMGEVDPSALHDLLRYNSIPAPHTIYRDTYKVQPGEMLRFSAPRPDAVSEFTYWSVDEVAEAGLRDPFEGGDTEAVDQLEELLADAVGMRMLADVPLGAFLSGGVDSSTVVALMQSQSQRPVKTFSIGSPDAAYDEAGYARAVAEHLGTDHTELYVSGADALAVVPRLAGMYDEPFADSSQIPMFLVSELARRDVTVALSGDGGDELFAGYNRHVWADRIWSTARRIPNGLRSVAAHGLTALDPKSWDRIFERLGPILPASLRQRTPGYKVHKLADSLRADDAVALYRRLVSIWPDPVLVVRGGREHPPTHAPDWDNAAAQMMLMDTQRYLPGDILTKVDRASMAVSLEARVPMLDHRVVEFAWRLPMEMKLRGGVGKWALREVLYRHVPRTLIERPKAGFAVPLAAWLRGPLREWAESLLSEQRLREDGYFHSKPIRAAWQQLLDGSHPREHQIWTVLMFQAWLDHQKSTAQISSVA